MNELSEKIVEVLGECYNIDIQANSSHSKDKIVCNHDLCTFNDFKDLIYITNKLDPEKIIFETRDNNTVELHIVFDTEGYRKQLIGDNDESK